MATATGGLQTYGSFVFALSNNTGAASEVFNFTLPRAFVVTNVNAVALVAQAGATVTVGKGASAFTGALAVAVLDTPVATLPTSTTNATFASGEQLRFTVATAGARCRVVVEGYFTPVADAVTVTV
jgi:hypothetical protein